MPPTKRPTTTTQSKDQSSAYAFSKAYQRVGRTPDKVLEWLIRFGEKDLPALSEKEWGQLRNELTAFTDIGHQEMLGQNLHEAIVSIRNLYEAYEAKGITPPQHREDPITLPLAEEFHAITKRAIKELVEKGWTILGEIATMPLIAKASIVKASKPPHKVLFKALNVWHLTLRDPSGISYTFNLHLLNVLKEVGSRLEICHSPTCRKYYVMHRYDQRYCTKRCRSRVAMKEWRQKRKNEKSKPKGGAKRGTKRKQ